MSPAPSPRPGARWTVDECLDATGNATIRWDDGTRNGDTESQPIATVYATWATARLIAAAPALLAACEAAYAYLGGDEGAPHYQDFAELQTTLRAALASARAEAGKGAK